MKEVSCRVFDLVFRDLGKRGLAPDFMTEGVPYEVAHLKDKRERIEWSTYVRIMENLSRVYDDDAYVELGGSFFENPLIRPFTITGRLLFSAKDFYLWTMRSYEGMGQQLFTCMNGRTWDLGPDRVDLEITLTDGYDMCRPFFLITYGAYRSMPKLLGLPHAEIELVELPKGAIYKIIVPRGGGLGARAYRTLTYPFAAKAVAQELKEANSEIVERYRELDAARELLDRQARQLKTAHAISQVIHGDLELGRTSAAIAQALVDVAGFAGAELLVEAEVEGQTVVHRSVAGVRGGAAHLKRGLSGHQRGLGRVALWTKPDADLQERRELLGYVVPTVAMAVENALAYRAVTDFRSNLEAKVVERTEQLALARDRLAETVERLEEAQAARSRIFANINHEIRTPLSLIVLALGRLKRRIDSKELTGQLAGIEGNVHRLLNLVDGLLLLAASQEDKLQLRPQATDLAAIARDLAVAWRPAAQATNVELEYEGPEKLRIHLDRAAIERVLANLLSNAVKFTTEGRITVIVEPMDGTVRVSVRDTGSGIDPAWADRLFERFEQGPTASQRFSRGSGIGLSIVKDVVEAHGGRVAAAPAEGGGSVFSFELPVADDQMPEVDPEEIEPQTTRMPPTVPHAGIGSPEILEAQNGSARATILVAEDEPDLRREIGAVLSAEHRVLLAPDGETALSMAREHLPDMLVTDIGMPGMDGLELTKAFRRLEGARLAPVLILTAFGKLTERLAGFDAGAVDYVVKPFEELELLARTKALLTLRDLALKLHESEKLVSLGTLSAGLAHELRNPANTVVNAVGPLKELLPKELLAEDRPEAELLEVLETGARQIAHLSRQLLGYVSHREITLSEESFEPLLDRALSLVKRAMECVTVRRRLAANDLLPCAPPFLIQALATLLDNAADAAGPGGWVEVTTRRSPPDFVIEIADSGPGVPPNLRERIFEPFFTTKSPGKGTGLGLVTARQVAEKHGGALRVVEHDGRTVFRLTIPLLGEFPPPSPDVSVESRLR